VRPPDELLARTERLLGSRPVSWRRGEGGYSIAERWTLDLADGRRVFTKMAPNDDQAARVRDEHRHMTLFDEDFRCEVIAFEDGEHPLLILEDLSHAHWPPPWEPGQVERVRSTLERIWAQDASQLADGARLKGMFDHWRDVSNDPSGFLSLGVASRGWFERNIEALRDATREMTLIGDDFLHMDVRSDNLCLLPDRVVFVDWNWAVRGPREIDLACLLPALRLEGGPLPEEVQPGLGAQAAAIAGYHAWYAPQPSPEGAPTVRRFQLRQLRIALPWACRELGLEQPDVPWAMREIEQIDADLAAGRIDETTWHERVEESLIDAYLASDDPRAQSGKGGDEADWRWARELILDLFPAPESTFLDIGCANGYLMESVHRWGAERGLKIEPYGLDISWRIAALAKHRLPHWRNRIFVGNAIDWDTPMRFDVVQAGLDEVPVARRRELVDRILRTVVKPGGILVFRAGRVVDGGYPTPDVMLREVGLAPDGIVERIHPTNGDVRRTAWLRAPLG
jgi:hypothetical protein